MERECKKLSSSKLNRKIRKSLKGEYSADMAGPIIKTEKIEEIIYSLNPRRGWVGKGKAYKLIVQEEYGQASVPLIITEDNDHISRERHRNIEELLKQFPDKKMNVIAEWTFIPGREPRYFPTSKYGWGTTYKGIIMVDSIPTYEFIIDFNKPIKKNNLTKFNQKREKCA